MVSRNLFQISSGNGIKPFIEPVMTYYHQWGLGAFIWWQLRSECLQHYLQTELELLLTHIPLVPHVYSWVNWFSIGSDNGLPPIWHQAITWTNTGLLSIGPFGTNFIEIWTKIQNFSITKMHLRMSSAKWRHFCSGRDELNSNRNWCEPSKRVAITVKGFAP